MSEIFEKVVTKLGKLEKYYVLGTSKDQIFIGTKIIITEYVKTIGVFQNFTNVVDKELPVFLFFR